MFTPPSRDRSPLNVQQPIPTSRLSQGGYSPTVEWLEQSAERMSLHSSSNADSHRGRNSQTRRRSDSRLSSLRSRSPFSSSPTHSYEIGSPWEEPIAEGDEHPALKPSNEHRYAFGSDHHVMGPTSAPADDHHQSYTDVDPVVQRNRYPSQPQSYGSHDPFERLPEDQRILTVRNAQSSISRGPSTATTSTMKHAGSLFRDFDGTHRAPTESGVDEGQTVDLNGAPVADFSQLESVCEVDDEMFRDLQRAYDEAAKDTEIGQELSEDNEGTRLDILPSQPHNLNLIEPPPAENMVYYPAPIPMQLNRPQRLSKAPPPSVGAQRRSQILGSFPVQARQSTVSLHGAVGGDEQAEIHEKPLEIGQSRRQQRQSVLNLQKLPPQLRASIFFDKHSVPHKVEIQQGSAVATLDSLLDASARAPMNASVDDTMRVAAANLANERKKSGNFFSLHGSKNEDARRSRISLPPFRKSSADRLSQLRQRASSALGIDAPENEPVREDGDRDEEARDDNYGNHDDDDGANLMVDHNSAADHSWGEAEGVDNEPLHNDEPPESRDEDPAQTPDFPQVPTTLLAELQLRKQELRSRTRTAANAFPNGMHSTLLELDAVAQIEKKNRKVARTTLAWEEPDLVAEAREKAQDENVPLAMLYPSKNGLASKTGGSDWDRPLGLLAKRDLEETEPLSKRRNRLKGITPTAASFTDLKMGATGEDDDDSEHEGETLAQRTRRLKSTKALNDAIGNGRQISEEFANDVMSQLGGLGDDKAKDKGLSGALEEETLGQRKRRLQAEARAAQNAADRGGLETLPASNPTGTSRQVSNESSGSVLLGQSEQHPLQRHQRISQQNQTRSTSLVDPRLMNSQEIPQGQGQSSGHSSANERPLQWMPQEIQNTNHRMSNVGTQEQFVAQQHPVMPHNNFQYNAHGFAQYNQFGQPSPMFNDKIDVMKRQTKAFIDGRYDDGPAGFAATRATSAFPHMQTQSSLQTRGFSTSGFGINVQRTNHAQGFANGPESSTTLGGQQMMPWLDQDAMSSNQRNNIDRWRQSVLP